MLVAGGWSTADGDDTDSVEIYDFSLAAWKSSTPLPSPRLALIAASTPTGLLVTGGGNSNGDFLDDILAWDPAMETWTMIGRMAGARDSHSVAAVPLSSVSDLCLP